MHTPPQSFTAQVERLRFRRAPLAAAAMWFASGIVLARYVHQPVIVLLGALGLSTGLGLLALRMAARVAWVAVAAVWIALGMAAGEWQVREPAPLALMGFADGLSRSVEGRVTRVRMGPRAAPADADAAPPWEMAEEAPKASGEDNVVVDLAVDRVERVTPDVSAMVPVAGGMRVTMYGSAPALSCGDRVAMPLRLRLPDQFRDAGAFDYGAYLLAQEGVAARANVAGNEVRVVGRAAASMRCRLYAAQAWAAGRMLGFAESAENRKLPTLLRLNETDARMLDAMLFGDRTGLTHTLRAGFERTGTFHLFVVSGLHVALLAGSLFWLLRRLRMQAWLATLLTLVATAFYAALTGFGQPSQRALAMTALYLCARLLSRERDSLNALGGAALAMLVWTPSSLFEASFQMTVLVIVAIAGIALPLNRRMFSRVLDGARDVFVHPRRCFHPRAAGWRTGLEVWGEALAGLLGPWARKGPARLVMVAIWICELAITGIVAELVLALPMAMYFHRAAVFALPANMLVLPVIGLLAVVAVATFCCSLLSPWLALAPGSVTALLLHGVTFAIGHIGHAGTADVRVPGPVWWVAVLAVAGWAMCCWAVRRGRWGALGTVLALPLIAAMILWPERSVTAPGALEITALDVGQGDSLLAVNSEGGTMLIDAGGPVGAHGVSEIVSNFDVGDEVVSPYLWTRKMRRIDIVVLTHAHTDHMGGMPAVLRNFHPRELWVGSEPDSALYRALMAEAAELGVRVRHVRAGEHVQWGEVEIAILAPAVSYANANAPRNDDSVVMRMQFGKASVLLEGDAETPSEGAMLAAGMVSPVTLLKVGHHGSRTSSTAAFVSAAAPHDAVISVGKHNTFGHPRGEVIARFASAGTHLFRTDEFGLTSFLLTPDGRIRERVGDTLLPAR